MPPAIVYSDLVDPAGTTGTLFEGKKFFLLQKIPARSRFIDDVVNNGGTVVKLEAQADFIIADHIRRDAPAGSLSYKFIEKAIKDGELPPEEDHLAAAKPQGKTSSRMISSSAPGRSFRTPFTRDDDVQLYLWVKQAEAQGMSLRGNGIYKELEEMNPRHTYQSWRDRYIKQLEHNPPKDLPSSTPPAESTAPTPPVVKPSAVKEARPAAAKTTVTKDGPTAAKVPRSSFKPSSRLLQTKSVRSVTTDTALERVTKSSHQNPASVATNNEKSPTTAAATAEERTSKVQPMEPAELQEPTADAAQDDDDVDNTIVPLPSLDPDSAPSTIPRFEDEDLDDWLSGAEAIQTITVGEYQEAWNDFATIHSEHTGQEWRAYYEQVVLPVYLENKDSLPQGAGKGRFRAIQAAFCTQGQPVYRPSTRSKPVAPVPSSSGVSLILPEKRKSSELKTEHKEPHKRQKVETTNVQTHTHTEPQLPTSTQAEDHISIKEPSEQQKFETSNVGTHTKSQPHKAGQAEDHITIAGSSERQKVKTTDVDMHTPTESQLPMNTQAEDPISISSSEHAEKVAARETREEDVMSMTSENDAAVQNQLFEEMNHTQNPSQTKGVALTVENLALAQAEHNPRQDKRALDIVPDDEGKDQGAFADSLLELLQQGPSANKDRLEALKVKSQHIDALAREYEAEEEIEDVEDDESDHTQFGQEAVPETVETQDAGSNIGHPSQSRRSPEAPASIDTNASPRKTPQKIETQDIDPTILDDYSDDEDDMQLDLPDPEGGWDVPSPHQSAKTQPTAPTIVLSTQQIFDAETQRLDNLDPAQPDPFSQDPAVAALSGMMSEKETSAFIAEHVQHGYKEKEVREALYYTSMRQRQCSIVMGRLRRTKEYPTKTAGVWSEQDDHALEGSDATKLKALNAKHGDAECDARMHFLAKYRKRAS